MNDQPPLWKWPIIVILLGGSLIAPLPVALHFDRFTDRQIALFVMLALAGAGVVAFGALEFLRNLREIIAEARRTKFTRAKVMETVVVVTFLGWLAWAEWPHLVSVWEATSP